MNNVVPVTALGAASVLFNRWLQRRNVPVLGTVAGLSNRALGTTVGTGLRVVATATQGVGTVVIGAGTLTRQFASLVEDATAPSVDAAGDRDG